MNNQSPITSTYTRITTEEIRALVDTRPDMKPWRLASMRGVGYDLNAYVILDEHEQWAGFLAVWESDGPRPTAETRFPVRRWDLSKNTAMTVNDLHEAVLRAMVEDIMQSARAEDSDGSDPQPPVACTTPGHDHTSTVDRDGNEVDPPIPMMCNHCGRPTHYDYAIEDYQHDDPAAPDCFLVKARADATACTV